MTAETLETYFLTDQRNSSRGSMCKSAKPMVATGIVIHSMLIPDKNNTNFYTPNAYLSHLKTLRPEKIP